MNIRSGFLSVLVAGCCLGLLANCSGEKKEAGGTNEEAGTAAEVGTLAVSEPQFNVDEQFQRQLSQVFTAYVDLKEAFVESDVSKVKARASETEEALAEVDMKLLSGAAHHDWMTYLTPMRDALEAIQSSDDIEAQRKSFSDLSKNLYKSIKAFGLDGEEAYYDYCPMAFNDQGAHWLSDNEKIRNPYFGDKMLVCGEVKEKLQ